VDARRIVAMGGGGFSMEPGNPLLDEFVLSLARSSQPRVCFLPTASGDADSYITRFYRAFAALDCRPAELRLFNRDVLDLESFVLAQDVIYVGGGNTANLSRHGRKPLPTAFSGALRAKAPNSEFPPDTSGQERRPDARPHHHTADQHLLDYADSLSEGSEDDPLSARAWRRPRPWTHDAGHLAALALSGTGETTVRSE
jgi:hypothetical protein